MSPRNLADQANLKDDNRDMAIFLTTYLASIGADEIATVLSTERP
ncbi:MAG: hypothetical protein ABRQ26_02750 [Syntrophomonadaceae bacterium]